MMAASAGNSSVLEEELTCPVCLDLYRDPHLLPCGHNFCLPCLRRLKSRSDRGRLRCPECRQSHRSSSNWQKNFKLANIADGFRRGDRSERCTPSRSDQVHCDYCPEDASRDAKGPAAVKTCLKCEVSMCSQHVQPHLELPAFREHPLVEPLGDMRTRKCSEHDEMFRYYCLDERLFLCNACTIEGTHSGHAIKTLKNAMKDFKACLDIQLHKTNRKILKAEKNRLEQKEIERQNKAYRDDTNQHLDAFRETSVARLDAFLSSLRDCISSRDGEQSSGIQQNLSRIAQDQSRLQDVHSGVQRLLQESDAFHFIKEYNSSIKRYRRLLRKPLFVPDEVTVDTEPLFETLEGKMCEFMAELRQDAHTLLSSICEIEGGDAEEEEDEDDDDEESCDDEDEEEESEEEMRSEEEEEQQDLTDSRDEEYSPEEEEDEED